MKEVKYYEERNNFTLSYSIRGIDEAYFIQWKYITITYIMRIKIVIILIAEHSYKTFLQLLINKHIFIYII